MFVVILNAEGSGACQEVLQKKEKIFAFALFGGEGRCAA